MSPRRAVSARPSALTSQAWTLAPWAAKASAMARPKPCAAPVTTTVLPANSIFMSGHRCGSGARKRHQIVGRECARPGFHLADHLDQSRRQRRRHAVFLAEGDDGAKLVLRFGLALAHRQVAPNPRMGFG